MGAAEVSLSKSEAYLMGYGVTKDEAKAKACFIKGVELSTEYFWNEKKTVLSTRRVMTATMLIAI